MSTSPAVTAPGPFDLAAFCAHPDDAELIMGGTLARQIALGRRVALVDLTRGEAGSRGTPETRAREAEEAARVLGVAHRESLGLPDARLEVTAAQKDVVVEALRRLRPRVVLLQHWVQRHPDHATAGRIVHEACFLSGLRNHAPGLGPAYRPFKLLYALGLTEPVEETAGAFLVDVSDVWEQKMRAIRCFASQFTPGEGETVALPFDRFQDTVELCARHLGARIGVRYAEAFVSREPLAVDDLLSLRGRSI